MGNFNIRRKLRPADLFFPGQRVALGQNHHVPERPVQNIVKSLFRKAAQQLILAFQAVAHNTDIHLAA